MRGSSCPDRHANCSYYMESKIRLKSSINACRYLCYLCFQKSCKASLITEHHLFVWHGPAVAQPRLLQSQIISSLRLEVEPFGPKDRLVFAAMLSTLSDVLSCYLLPYLQQHYCDTVPGRHRHFVSSVKNSPVSLSSVLPAQYTHYEKGFLMSSLCVLHHSTRCKGNFLSYLPPSEKSLHSFAASEEVSMQFSQQTQKKKIIIKCRDNPL